MRKIDKNMCDGCGTCVAVCPQNAILMPNVAVINSYLCVDCEICVNICPIGALK